MAAVMATTRGSRASDQDGLAEQLRIRRFARRFPQRHHRTVFALKRGGRMKGRGVFGGRLKAMTLFRHHVQQHRPGNLTNHAEIFLQLPDVVAVDRSDIAEAQVLKNHAAQQPGLDGVLHLGQKPFDRITDDGHVVQEFLDLQLQSGVKTGRSDPIERFGQPAHPRTNRHLVVIENDDEIFFQAAGVVHGLENCAAGKGAVADDGHRATPFFRPEQIVAALQPRAVPTLHPACPVINRSKSLSAGLG